MRWGSPCDGRRGPRTRGPSMSTTCLSVSSKTPCTQSRNPSSTPVASSRAKTRPGVLCEGDSVRQLQEGAQPGIVELAEEGDGRETAGSTDNPGADSTGLSVRLCSWVRSPRGSPGCPGARPGMGASGRLRGSSPQAEPGTGHCSLAALPVYTSPARLGYLCVGGQGR